MSNSFHDGRTPMHPRIVESGRTWSHWLWKGDDLTGQLVEAGWYHAQGDAPGTQRYWDGAQWTTGPVPAPSANPGFPAAPPPLDPSYSSVEAVERSPWGWFKYVLLENYSNFNGRAHRAEFWWYYLIYMLAIASTAVPFFAIAASAGEEGEVPVLAWIFLIGMLAWILATFVPTLAVTVRRLHDTDRSGGWYFVSFIPYVGGLILLIFLIMGGTKGSNQYGADPTGKH